MLQVLIGIIAIAVIVVIIFTCANDGRCGSLQTYGPGWWPWKKPG